MDHVLIGPLVITTISQYLWELVGRRARTMDWSQVLVTEILQLTKNEMVQYNSHTCLAVFHVSFSPPAPFFHPVSFQAFPSFTS